MMRVVIPSVLAGVLLSALIGMVSPGALPWLAGAAVIGIGYTLWHRFLPRHRRDAEARILKKLHKKRRKTDKQKHRHLHDQIDYIAREWGYTKEQQKIVERFLATKAYDEIYNRLTASLLPQMIQLIDHCNAQERKGCQRDVARRLRSLTDLMRQQTRKHHQQTRETYETTLEVYDRLLGG